MIYRRKIIYLLLFFNCTCSVFVKAQSPGTLPNIILPEKARAEDAQLQTLIDGEYILGVPYMVNTWQPGVVLLKNGNTYGNYKLKYDLYNQVVVFLNGKDSLEVADPIKEFQLEEDSVSYHHFINADLYGKISKPLFYEVLVETPKGHLLKAYRMVVSTTDRIINARQDKFLNRVNDYYYYNATNGKVIPLGHSAGTVLSALKLSPEQQAQLHFFTYNFDNEKDLVKFFNVYLQP